MSANVIIGVVLGLLASFYRGGIEFTIMRLMAIMLALPSLLLALALAVAVRGPGLINAMNAIAIAIAIAIAMLPNGAAPLIVPATPGFSTPILDAAALGFLGLGAQPPTPERGSMLASALEFIQSAWRGVGGGW